MSEATDGLARRLEDSGIEAYFAHHPIDMGYLAGFEENAHERFLTLAVHRDRRVALIAPSLSAAQARRLGIADVRSWADGEDPYSLVRDLADEWGLQGRVALDEEMPARMVLGLQAALPDVRFVSGGPFMGPLMRVKSPAELALLRRAGGIADEAFAEVLPTVRVGQTEAEIARSLFDAMERRGGKPTFAIVAAGANGAEPHHLSDDTLLAAGDVVIMDFGCEVGGYQSDITRTVAIHHATDEEEVAYRTVYQANLAARAAIRPGVACGEVDAAARDIISAAGMGEAFFHRTGHGLGRRGHEEPNIVAGSEFRLEPGNVFSVEPGVYFEGRFGVRIENIVACSKSGHESMNAEPSPTLQIVGL